jgi:hypothetical protein
MKDIGFKALKDLMVERGVPPSALKTAMHKFALKEIAEKKHPECYLRFVL